MAGDLWKVDELVDYQITIIMDVNLLHHGLAGRSPQLREFWLCCICCGVFGTLEIRQNLMELMFI